MTTIRATVADFLAEPGVYCRLQDRGVTVLLDDGSALVPSHPMPCDECQLGLDHDECRVVRGLMLELERVTAERDELAARLR